MMSEELYSMRVTTNQSIRLSWDADEAQIDYCAIRMSHVDLGVKFPLYLYWRAERFVVKDDQDFPIALPVIERERI